MIALLTVLFWILFAFCVLTAITNSDTHEGLVFAMIAIALALAKATVHLDGIREMILTLTRM